MIFTDFVEQQIGSRNWVVARRTRRIVEKYGEGVFTMSSRQFKKLRKKFDIANAEDHPAYPLLKKWLGSHCDSVNTIRMLREAGFCIEKVSGE